MALLSAAVVAATWLPAQADMRICTGGNRAERKVTCLVDGDTGWEVGVKWRLLDVDTPENPAQAECDQEVEYAKAATYRMLELMSEGYTIVWAGKDDGGNRELVRIRLRDGSDAGAVLIAEGHAVRWPHRSGVWCARQ